MLSISLSYKMHVNLNRRKLHASVSINHIIIFILIPSRIYDGTTPGLIVGRPDLIKEIMVGKTALDVFPNRRAVKTSHPVMAKFLSSLEDEAWKRVRSITAPTFSSGKLRGMLPFMTDAARDLIATLKASAVSNSDVDMKSLFGTYTMDVIAYSAFATAPTPDFVHQATQLFTFPFWRKFLDYVVPMWALELVGFTVLPPYPMEFFREITIRAIRHRRATGIERKDFLQLLMQAEAAPGSNLGVNERKLSEEEILAQAVLFFSVGFETSSQLLTYASYCLALNPEAQDKAYQEIREMLDNPDEGEEDEEEWNNGMTRRQCERLSKLPYLNAVVDEALRLYNPVLRMERRANRDFVLGNTGITIPKGMIVGIPVWALHHSEKYFPQPEKFLPERFLPENKDQIVPSTYLPFGEGPRNCIGSQFALLECRVALAKILVEFRLIPSKNTKVPLNFFPTGRPLLGPKAIVVKVEKR